ncbi:uncharacterized protein LOC143174538 [Nomia melanderi]|uniref:uncharacterized protein LOC143174538 n=1 Tax=Nomia melanderi TaxID=2448451 RepID=UPI003FCC65A9
MYIFYTLQKMYLSRKDHFCSTEPLCKAIHLSDDIVSIRTCTDIILDKIQEMLSFCVLQEGSEKIVGVLIASYFDKNKKELQISPTQGNAIYTIAKLKRYAVKEAHFYETLNAEKLICIDVLCVKSEHQRKGLGTALVRSCVSRATKIRFACVAEFTSGAAYTIAMRLGFEIYFEIPYEVLDLIDPGFRVFETCQSENYSLTCMALAEPPEEIEPLQLFPPPMLTKEPLKKRRKTNNKKKAKKR